MSAPESVRTKDGMVWTLRTVTSSGIALYAPKGVCECPAFVMATLAELAEHGIVGSADVLPMPVGPVSQQVDADRAKAPWGRGEDGRPLLGPGAHWTDVPEVVDQELVRIQGRVNQAQSGHWYMASDTEAWRPAGTVRTNVDGYQRTVGRVTNMGSADLDLVLHAHDDLSWCLDMVAKFRARIAELEAERHETNESLDDAAQELRARPSCLCPPADRPGPHQLGCPQAEVPPSERPVNGLTAAFAPVASLREDVSPQVEKLRNLLAGQRAAIEDPHDSPLHHDYRVGHDLPEGCRLSEEQVRELGNPFLGGGA